MAKTAPEITPEVLVEAIQGMAAAMKKLDSTKLKRSAIVALIHDHTRIPKKTIEMILYNLDTLETIWLKK